MGPLSGMPTVLRLKLPNMLSNMTCPQVLWPPTRLRADDYFAVTDVLENEPQLPFVIDVLPISNFDLNIQSLNLNRMLLTQRLRFDWLLIGFNRATEARFLGLF
jgi:hypothetical protein